MKQFHTAKINSPQNKIQGTLITGTVLTPIGQMVVSSTETGICLLEFLNNQPHKLDINEFENKLNGIAEEGENEHIRQVKQELEEYFAGNRMQFNVPVHPMGTAFQLSVWNYLMSIPFGNTTSYMKQAHTLGNPNGVRAVAAANAQNKIAIIIPCHRVIATNGKLTGYAGGLERKKWLLDFEARLSGVRYGTLFDENYSPSDT
jgi:AraC family transcriptional regulator, regulatory protein of adaptative response / methylated-DNA-[protein]-cysteine methyltransferase